MVRQGQTGEMQVIQYKAKYPEKGSPENRYNEGNPNCKQSHMQKSDNR